MTTTTEAYHEATGGRPARPYVVEALERIALGRAHPSSVDLSRVTAAEYDALTSNLAWAMFRAHAIGEAAGLVTTPTKPGDVARHILGAMDDLAGELKEQFDEIDCLADLSDDDVLCEVRDSLWSLCDLAGPIAEAGKLLAGWDEEEEGDQ